MQNGEEIMLPNFSAYVFAFVSTLSSQIFHFPVHVILKLINKLLLISERHFYRIKKTIPIKKTHQLENCNQNARTQREIHTFSIGLDFLLRQCQVHKTQYKGKTCRQ